MKNIILGNGINIQFGGLDYTNKHIINRALLKLKLKKYNQDVYTDEIRIWIKMLYQTFPNFIKGNYDNLAVIEDEKVELSNFKTRYKTVTPINEIGFEDFFLLNELHCRKNKITNPEKFYFQEFLRRLFLDSIFNNEKINFIHENFSSGFIDFLNLFDNIFTTNYDRNIESATQHEVLYLHGAFHVLASEYDPKSFRNQLSDRPFEKTPVIKGYEHVFSTALTGSSGAFKQYANDSQEKANSGIEKFAVGYIETPELRPQIDAWKDSDNEMVRNLYEGIMLKIGNPELKISIDYALNKLTTIKGKVVFMGLSPNNDTHIVSKLQNNKAIDLIEYYYYDISKADKITSLFKDKEVKTTDIKEFWKKPRP
jgi:hypothetical protein